MSIAQTFSRMRLRRLRNIREQQAAQAAAQQQAAQAAQAAADAAQQKQKEQQALVNASAITNNGSTVETVASNTTNQASLSVNKGLSNTTAAPSTSDTYDDTAIYINNLQNRRKRRGAPMAQVSNVLGQNTILGV